MNINFTVTGCCGPALPFDPYDMQNIPYQLYNAGVTDEEWAEHVKRLVKVNNMRQAGCSFQCLLNCCLPMILPCLCPYFCQKCAKEVYAWDAELRKWQENFNNEVLFRQGCFVKTKSNCWVTYNEKGEKQRFYLV